MYHVNPPGIENRVKYTITTRRKRKGLCAKATSNSHKNALRSACTSRVVFPHLTGWKRSGSRFCPCRVLSSANANQERDLMNSMYFSTSERWEGVSDLMASTSGSVAGGEKSASRPTRASRDTPNTSAIEISTSKLGERLPDSSSRSPSVEMPIFALRSARERPDAEWRAHR